MVKLDKIYTKGGDGGETSLAGGTRVSKDHPRIRTFAAIDEANATLGLARCSMNHLPHEQNIIAAIQNDLFDVGADLATPVQPQETCPRIDESYVQRLEQEIDTMNDQLHPLRSFILPGGSEASAWLHLARTIVRRAESSAHELRRSDDTINQQTVIYLNRLSDHLFVFARLLNGKGADDILWQPSQNRQ